MCHQIKGAEWGGGGGMPNWTGNCLISNLIPAPGLANSVSLWLVRRFHIIIKPQSNHRFKHTFYHHLHTHDWDALQLPYTFNNVMGWVVLYSHRLHCKEDQIDVFPEMKLRGLVPNLTYIYLWADRSWEHINCPQKHESENWEWGRAVSSLGRYVFGSEISYNKAPPRLPGLGC